MNNISSGKENFLGILLKPDAVSDNLLFSSASFYDCLASLNSVLEGNHSAINAFHLPNSIHSHHGAFRQVSERSLSEHSFSFPILNQKQVSDHISNALLELEKSHKNYSVSDIIVQLINIFNFKIQDRKDFIFDEKDCKQLYSEIFLKDAQLYRSIQQYLVSKLCRVFFLSGQQNITAVEYIKTYVRYFFKYEPGQKHRLENFIHSLNGIETKYFHKKLLLN